MLCHVARPHAFVVFKVIVDVVNNAEKKRTGACGRVKYLDFVHIYFLFAGCLDHLYFCRIGQAVGEFKVRFLNMVDAADNVRDNRLRRVVNAACLAHLRIIGGQKCFIEVNNRVFLACVFAEILEDGFHIRMMQ